MKIIENYVGTTAKCNSGVAPLEFVLVCIVARVMESVWTTPGPYNVLFNLSEFQCSDLEMGKGLAPFRDILRFKDIVCTSCGI